MAHPKDKEKFWRMLVENFKAIKHAFELPIGWEKGETVSTKLVSSGFRPTIYLHVQCIVT